MNDFSNGTGVVLVGANTLAREGMRRILNEAGFSVQASLASCDAFHECDELSSHSGLIIVDCAANGELPDGIHELRDAYDEAGIVVLADTFCFDQVVEAFRLGVDGYIVKDIACEPMVESLRLVAMGEKVMPSKLAAHLPLRVASAAPNTVQSTDLTELLSEREIETLRYLLMGCPNKVIAPKLNISEATVKVHVKAILRKLKVQNRTQAAIWAVNNGIELTKAEPIWATMSHQPMSAAVGH